MMIHFQETDSLIGKTGSKETNWLNDFKALVTCIYIPNLIVYKYP